MAASAEAGAQAFSRATQRLRMSVEELTDLAEKSGLDVAQPNVAKALEEAKAPGTGLVTIPDDPGSVLNKLIENNLAVPDWSQFASHVEKLYHEIKREVKGGHNATYIPVLAEQDPSWFGISVCTADGQRFDIGDTDVYFSIQSCVKPLMYSTAVEDLGLHEVHRHVGIEPSGLAFNEVSLNADNLPHNPMINAGAIASGSCIKPGLDMAGRFKYFMDRVASFAGGERIGFSQPTYLCEHETAWRNNALLYYMQEAGVFSKDVSPAAVLDFYIQCCAIEVNTVSASVIAATMASGGVCPLNGEQTLSPATIKSCLTLMFSCGMYDYSGEWCVHVGLPAKSGVAGLVYIVIPNVMGIAVFSPPLDSHGNSVKGVEFALRLLRTYTYGIFDDFVRPTVPGRPPTAAHPAAIAPEDVDEPAKLARAKSKSQASVVASMHLRQTLVLFGRLHKNMVFIKEHFAKPGARVAGVPPTKYHVPVSTFQHFLKVAKGVESTKRSNPAVHGLLARLSQPNPGFISLKNLLEDDDSAGHNIILRALLGELIFNDFESLVGNMTEMFADAKTMPVKPPKHLSPIQQEVRAMSCKDDHFGLSICTVDGQRLSLGDSNAPFPIMDAAKPLLYAIGLMDCGKEAIHEWVASEPCAFPTDTFELRTPGSHGGEEDEDDSKTEASAAAGNMPSGRSELGRRTSQFFTRKAADSDSDSDEDRPARPSASSTHRGTARSGDGKSVGSVGAGAGAGPAKLLSPPPLGLTTLTSPSSTTLESITLESRPEGTYPMPYNPFMDGGAMVVCSLIGRGHAKKKLRSFHDAGSRFTHILNNFQRMAGSAKVGFNNPVFLALKQRALKTLAVSHFMKGMGCYPPRTQPTDMAHLFFQTCATEMTADQLAVVASTLANGGVCPLTGEAVLPPMVVKNVLSLLYSCGMSTYTGKWAFHVGIPATSACTGATMVVIPGVMGLVLYQPDIDTTGLSPRVDSFCRHMTKRYCVNIWDQLVNQTGNIAMAAKDVDDDDTDEGHTTLLFFNMCTAAQVGNLAEVLTCIRDGVSVTRADYDKRTALHIAACENHLDVCKALVQAGASTTAVDRWDTTPMDEAEKLGHDEIVEYFREVQTHAAEAAAKAAAAKPAAGAGAGAGASLTTNGGPVRSPDSVGGASTASTLAPKVGFINLNRGPSGKLTKVPSMDIGWK